MDEARYIVGVDEVGRGPVAGPVAVGAVVYEVASETDLKRDIPGVRDSKKLPMHKREAIFSRMREKKSEQVLDFAIAYVGPGTIDRKGMVYAVKRAINSSLKRLRVSPDECLVLLDGGLRAPKEYRAQKTIIRGDDKEFAISLASIAAKVSRDKKMIAVGGKYEAYLFEQHKGYGTQEHMKLIKKYGLTDIHRRSFLKRITAGLAQK